MSPFKSHPDLLLSEHIAQILRAFEALQQWHSTELITEEIKDLFRRVALLHDLGKSSDAFQAYIEAPALYKGDNREKAHTPLSLLLTLLLAQKENWPPLTTLLLASCVCAHHGALRCLPSEGICESFSRVATLDDFSSGHTCRVLSKQIASLDLARLGRETGIDFEGIALSPRSVRQAADFIVDELMSHIQSLGTEPRVAFRLKAQLVFSLLLETDKALLAVTDPMKYIQRQGRRWEPGWVDERIGKSSENSVNLLRRKAREELKKRLATVSGGGVYHLTAPTGIGKTLLAATWALETRAAIESKTGVAPKIVLVLPFLSIIDQTAREYRDLLWKGGHESDGAWLLACHSLSERKYGAGAEEDEEPFFIDTWRTELVITTYDQLLLSLLDPKGRYQMRFHNLCDALIVMDEVQSVPCNLWRLMDSVFRALAQTSNSRILLMSATLPPFVSGAVALLLNHREYFSAFSRYELRFRCGEPLGLPAFCLELEGRLPQWLEQKERVLVTLNTRRCAQIAYEALSMKLEDLRRAGEDSDIPLLLLSSDITPRDRIEKIGVIKKGGPCIVVSTQCIEAGVDIDMGFVIRDFAPWDSIVQVAGRCNREGKRGSWLPVEIIDLVSENGRRYSEMIYDAVALQATRALFESRALMREEEVLSYSDRYFQELDRLKDTGSAHVEAFAGWQEMPSVKELLRGKSREQYSFLVLEQDPDLEPAMKEADAVPERWKRREAWRRLSGRMAQVSVSLYARAGFRPESIANQFLGHWILRKGHYDPNCGISIENQDQTSDGITMVF